MIKPIRFSAHAETVIQERGLERSWVETTARQPDWRTDDPAEADLVERRYRSLPECGGRILRVACVETRKKSV